MIPAGIDTDDLARQIGEDAVAFGGQVPTERIAELEPGLLDATVHADTSGFGSLGIVVLGETPAHTPDLRDVAQDVLLATDVDTVIVRAPGSGAVVSDLHTRADIESAQYPFLGNPDVVGGVFEFIDDVNGSSVSWPSAVALIVIAMVAVAVFTALGARKAGQRAAQSSMQA